MARESEGVDAIPSDVELSGERGFHLACWLRAHPDRCVREIPALAVGALRSRDDGREALATGFVGFLAKP